MSLANIFIDSLSKWNINALKAELRTNNLELTGERSVLVQRLQEFYKAKLSGPDTDQSEQQRDSLEDDKTPSSLQLTHQDSLLTHTSTRNEHRRSWADACNIEDDNDNLLRIVPSDEETSELMEVLVDSQERVGQDRLSDWQRRQTDRLYSPTYLPSTGAAVSQFSASRIAESNRGRPTDIADLNPRIRQSQDRGQHFTLLPNLHKQDSKHVDRPDIRISSHANELETPASGDFTSRYFASVNSSHDHNKIVNTVTTSSGLHGRCDYSEHVTPHALLPSSTASSPIYSRNVHRVVRSSAAPAKAFNNRPDINQASQTRVRVNQTSSVSSAEELHSLELQLKILKTKDEIRNVQHRLSLPPDHLRVSELNATSSNQTDLSNMLSLVKKSVDISSLPPAKPMVFSGNPLEYPQWKSSFDLLIENKDLSPAQKFSYLQNYLCDKALKCVQGYIMFNSAEAYAEARKSLDERFGNQLEIADSFRDKLESWPKLKISDSEGLREYADFLKQCKLAMTEIRELDKLNDARELKHLVNCLPKPILTRWSRESGLRKLETKENPVFSEYADFVMKEALLACDKTTSIDALTSFKKEQERYNINPIESLSAGNENVHVQSALHQLTRRCHYCKTTHSHNTSDCNKVAKMTYVDQQAFFRRENLCFQCLNKGHGKQKCDTNVRCKYQSCGEQHPTCVHRYNTSRNTSSTINHTNPNTNANQTGSKLSGEDVVLHSIELQDSNIHFKQNIVTSMIVPVFVFSPDDPENEILTYALLDSMSDASIISEELSDYLSIRKDRKRLRISTVTTPNKTQWCDEICNLQVRGYTSKKSDSISIPKVYSQSSIPANRSHIPTPETAMSWKHLNHLADKMVPLQNCEVGLILGYNCSAALLPLEIVKDKSNLTLPYAVMTSLGWSIVGGQNMFAHHHITHRVCVKDITKEEILQKLEEDLSVIHDKQPMSQNDLYFIKKMESEIKQVDGFYTMPLPFKERPVPPNNRAYALKRFRCLENKLKSNPQLKAKYQEFMTDMIEKGEAEMVHEPAKDSWYIPHHGVFHPHKPDKLRVVYDCSATYRNFSLNKSLLKGPDLNNSLAGLLCRFRKDKVAVICDIKKMFHQFRVAKDDRKYLRFLWYKKGTDKVVDYQMNVHLFGAISSPSCAIFGLKKIADDYADEFPKAALFIKDNFYVDDGLASVPTATEAINLIEDAKALAEKGNLVLHKFLSNNEDVAIKLNCESSTANTISQNATLDRALGLCWNITEDHFTYPELQVGSCSRRGILSTVASLIDPLGFITLFSLIGKLILQSLCYDSKDWDETLGTTQTSEWLKWVSSSADLVKLRISRCYLGEGMIRPYTVELHTFCDASSFAYGTCSYLRIINTTMNTVSVSLAMAKSRVAPRKAVTIPRLELQAATLATKVASYLKKELKYTKISCHFWSDSETVLGYINNESKRFHVFVANRVQRIRDTTQPDDWSYVSTADNPADVASRGSYINDFPESWFNGPKFLRDVRFTPKKHVSAKAYSLNPEDPEIKVVFSHAISITDDIVMALEKHSKWTKTCGVMGYILRFATRNKVSVDLSPCGKSVFRKIVYLVQQQFFAEEISCLKKGLSVSKSSSLYTLDAFLDNNGLLRVGGRLRNALSSYEERHPVVLPSKSAITKTFARHVHKETGHQGRTATMNAIRCRGVHIVGHGVKTISSLIFNCVRCKRLRGHPKGQKMADLPEQRTEPSPPFTFIGMDVFGPFMVKDARKEIKRYALLCTCLCSRAVHLEVLDDMSTDCFINSFRSFLAIRGPVKEVYSDQGTNFVGARNEFLKCISAVDNLDFKQFLKANQCKFKFNAPTASHMGGVWERMIRTIRDVLNGLLIERIAAESALPRYEHCSMSVCTLCTLDHLPHSN